MPPPVELVPRPATGRLFDARRRVRLGDAAPSGRLRLDACARYLQDLANDDSRAAGGANPTAWVARRTTIAVDHFPQYLDMLQMHTWCSGIGPRWAERRSSLHGLDAGGGVVEAATLWVHVDLVTMKPISVPATFADAFAEACGGRTVSARLHLASTPPTRPDRVERWTLRQADFDVLGHVNNSVFWAMVEEIGAARQLCERPVTVTLEHHDAVDPSPQVTISVCDTAAGLDLWVHREDGRVAAVASLLVADQSRNTYS